MPFVANTPESLVQRSDSKNPNTTCRGITSSGRPCRNALNASCSTKPAPPRKSLRVHDRADPGEYCWRHKDQASAGYQSGAGTQPSNPLVLEERTSIDTLADRLGLLHTSPSHHAAEKPSRPQVYHPSHSRPPSKPVKEFSFCCFRIPLDLADQEPTRPPRPHPHPISIPASSKPSNSSLSSQQYLAPTSAIPCPMPYRPGVPNQTPSCTYTTSSSSSSSSNTFQTSQYLSLIPPNIPPRTASQLMAELAKPPSRQDEPGYIYIFWLAPKSQLVSASTHRARSILDAESCRAHLPPRPSRTSHRPDDILTAFAEQAFSLGTCRPATTRSRALGSSSSGGGGGGGGGHVHKTILLKIGRANNVQRRMNEWKRQCGYDLSLVRFYPYVQSGTGLAPRKTPHSHKVERLIHIELRGLGLGIISDKGQCEACGREHKEWFEVDASREGVLRVDEAIRRWTDWDEGRAASLVA